MPKPTSFVSPPIEGYEILLSDFAYPDEGVDGRMWCVSDIRLYGRSIAGDLRKICGQYWQWPSLFPTKDMAQQAALGVVHLHREHCYTIKR